MKKIMVFLVALAMVLGFTASAMADATLYGSARFDTFWHDQDEEFANQTDLDDDQDLEWQMGKLSRFGVNFKQGDITGKFEIDARAGSITTGTNMNIEDDSGSSYHGNMRLRHLWGAWNFGAGELCIGHRHSLYTYYVSQFGNDAGAGMAQWGGYNLRYFRASQIRLTFGNLKIAFLTPDTSYKPIDVTSATGAEVAVIDADTTLPRIELAYTLNLEPVTLDFMGGYQSFEVTNTATGDEDDIDSFVGLVKATANFGPLYLKALVRYAQNGGNYGIWTRCEERAAWYNGDVEDAEAWGYGVGIGYKVSDMITLEAAFAGTDATNDDLPGKPDDDAMSYGILCKITPAPGVTIQPELMIVDDGDTDYAYRQQTTGGDDEGEEVRIGVFWKIDFK
jgi:opacity protein-like surface antigen